MSTTEKNEFSRTVSRKMKAINILLEKETGSQFISGREKMKPERLARALHYLHRFSRKFKNKHVFLSGSFLYAENYHDIDMFVVSKYDKDDYRDGPVHINYLTEDVYHSLFFASISKLSVSNRKMGITEISEEVTVTTFISLYQELWNDLDQNHPGIRKTLRDFILQAAYLSKSSLPDSAELHQHIASILSLTHKKEMIQRLFVESLIMGVNKAAIPPMKEMISSYQGIMEEYPQHQHHYREIMKGFREVITLVS